MFVYIGGVPGVGKTTIITETEKLARKRKIKMERVIGTSILCELAGVATVAELRALPESVRRALRPEMYRRLYELDRKDPEVIRLADGHFVYFDTEGEDYGIRQIQPWDREQMGAIALIVAGHRTILERRLRDVNERQDRKRNIEFVAQEQKMEISIAISQAAELGIPLCLISNEGYEEPSPSVMLFTFCIHQSLCRKMLF